MAGRPAAPPTAAHPYAGDAHPGDIVGRYQAALDGYYREPVGPHPTHRGPAELRSFFATRFGAGGGIGWQHCVVTDDGVRCALDYNCVRRGSHDLPPQAGLGVYERSADGLLAATRADDIEPPAGHF